MKTLIAIPAMQTVPTKFLRCIENLRRLPDTYTTVSECSLIHDARNEFASIAIINGFDRVLWIDSDMVFDNDLLLRLSAHLDNGKRMVCGLFFKRVLPTAPVIYSRQERRTDPVQGEYIKPVIYEDYPTDKPFEVDACGFGAVMTDVALLKAVWDQYGPPFSHYMNLGEDMSFCYRVRQMGQRIWCDPSVTVGHIGQMVYDESVWLTQQAHRCGHDTADTASDNAIRRGEPDANSTDTAAADTNHDTTIRRE